MKLPTAEEEANNPAAADEAYEAASAWLLANTRDAGAFRLIFEENMNYGFRRNYWALKPIAVLVDVVLILLLSILFVEDWKGDFMTTLQRFDALFWAAVAASTLHLATTLYFATQAWVRVVAEEYARQLLAASDVLSSA